MPFCGKCGTKLVDDSNFCHMCGSKFSINSEICKNCGQLLIVGSKFCHKCGSPSKIIETKQVSENEINNSDMIRCPNCGSNIGRMDAACKFCGMQIVQRSVSGSVKAFAEELSRIELEAKDVTDNTDASSDNNSAWSGFLGMDRTSQAIRNKEMEKRYGNKAFERKISLINSFPIPNTVEEITEFILLAVANIDTKFGRKSYENKTNGTPGNLYFTEVKLATTWVNKLEQAYNKASIVFPNDPVFPRIQHIYVSKMKELRRL